MNSLFTLVWWKAAGMRALRTAVVLAVPYAPVVMYDNSYGVLASVAGFGAISSLLFSLFGIAETGEKTVPWYWAIFERVVKTAAQALLAAFGTATMFSEVDWSTVPALVGSAVLGSLLLAVLKQLPEADEPVATATTLVTNFNAVTGTDTVQQVPMAAVTASPIPVTFGDININTATKDTPE
jgi:hypothetical protein